MDARQRVSVALVRRWAVEAEADPRSVRRVLAGETVRGMVDARIRRVLTEHGYQRPIPNRLAPHLLND